MDLFDSKLNILKREYEKNLIVPLVKQSPQFFLCPIGLIGAGKTTVMKLLTKKFSLIKISTDDIRKILKKQEYNFKRAAEITFCLIEKYARQGYSIAIDADCVRPSKRKKIEKLAKEVGAKIIWIHINSPESYIINKLRKFKHTWLFKDSNDAIQNYFARKPLHKNLNFPFIYTFDTSHRDLKKQINKASVLIKAKLRNFKKHPQTYQSWQAPQVS